MQRLLLLPEEEQLQERHLVAAAPNSSAPLHPLCTLSTFAPLSATTSSPFCTSEEICITDSTGVWRALVREAAPRHPQPQGRKPRRL